VSEPGNQLQAAAELAYAAVNAGDFDAFLAVVAEDVEFTSLVAEAEGATFRGHEGVRTWWDRIRGAFDEARWEVLEIRVSGNRAVARVRIAGTMSGVPMEQTMWQAIELREGKASRWAFFRSEREALEATESWPQ